MITEESSDSEYAQLAKKELEDVTEALGSKKKELEQHCSSIMSKIYGEGAGMPNEMPTSTHEPVVDEVD